MSSKIIFSVDYHATEISNVQFDEILSYYNEKMDTIWQYGMSL